MRKLILVLFVLAIASPLFAGTNDSDTVVLTVVPAVNVSIEIDDEDDDLNFGTVDLGVTCVNSTAIDVQNNGNARSEWKIEITADFVNWTNIDTTAVLGQDEYRLGAMCYHDGATGPAIGDFDVSETSVVVADGASDTMFGGDYVEPLAERDLYFRLEMPNTVTANGSSTKTMTVTLNASIQ